MTRTLTGLLLIGCAVSSWGQALKPQYPVKAIRILVGFAAGGANDLQARLVGQKLSASLGQPVVVDNRPGADGIIATDMAAKSSADGYTLILISAGHSINPNFHRSLPYDPVEDFTPIIQLSRSPFVVVVHPSLPVRSVRDLIELAKSQPGKLNFGSAGKGSSQQLATELFNSMARIKMAHVPYKGAAPATIELIAGQVQVMINNAASTLPAVRTGKLRAIAVTTAQRSTAAPELPTVAETLPGYEVEAWYGVLAPRGMPTAIVAKLNEEMNKAIAAPDVQQQFVTIGLEPTGAPGRSSAII